jgi:hypothetical protein
LQAAKKAAAAVVVPPIDSFSLSELEGAAHLLQAEVDAVIAAMGHSGVAPEDYTDTWQVSETWHAGAMIIQLASVPVHIMNTTS